MSLVDAIRQAATTTPSTPDIKVQSITPTSAFAPAASTAAENSTYTSLPASATPTHSVVRLELMLSQEQLHELLRGLINGVHAVFTLREAAHYLRIPSTNLLSMAEGGNVPGFVIEGKWRFSKAALDEWMAQVKMVNAQEQEQNSEAQNAG